MSPTLKRGKKPQAGRPGSPPRDAARVVSLPRDVVLAPQAGVPLQGTGTDRSRPKGQKLSELSWAKFDQQVQALALTIRRRFHPDAVVGVAHGGVFVGGALASALACEFFPVRISRRSRDARVRLAPRMYGQMPKELKGKRVLVVDDVAASGDTIELAKELATKVGAKHVATAALIRRDGAYEPDYCALVTEDFMVFPWDYEPVASDERFEVDPDKAGA